MAFNFIPTRVVMSPCCMYKLHLHPMHGTISLLTYKLALFSPNSHKKCYSYKKSPTCMKGRIEDIFILHNINIISSESAISNSNWNEMCTTLEQLLYTYHSKLTLTIPYLPLKPPGFKALFNA